MESSIDAFISSSGSSIFIKDAPPRSKISQHILTESERFSTTSENLRSRSSSISSTSSLTRFAISIDVPLMKAGFMQKKCQLMPMFKTRYFWLEKGILSNYLDKDDSRNIKNIENRSKKKVSLKGYTLSKDPSKNIITLVPPLFEYKNDLSLRSLILCVDDIIDYELWEYAFNEHINYANLSLPSLESLNTRSSNNSPSKSRSNSISSTTTLDANHKLNNSKLTAALKILNDEYDVDSNTHCHNNNNNNNKFVIRSIDTSNGTETASTSKTLISTSSDSSAKYT